MSDELLKALTNPVLTSLLGSGLIAALLTQYSNLNESRKKSRQDLYFRYSSRYTSIMAHILEQVPDLDSAEFSIEKPKLRQSMVLLFMLLSEEYYLHQKKLVDKQSWEAWEKNIDKKLKHKIFRQGWDYVSQQMGLHGDFGTYMKERLK
jgi:hypothetical protein